MKTFFSRQVAALGLLALLGGGCVAQKQAEPGVGFKLSQKPVEAEGTKSVEIGEGIQMEVPSSWRVSGGGVGKVVHVSDCPESNEDYFCADDVFVTDADTGPQALLIYSEKTSDFVWYCPDSACSSDEAKLAQVEIREDYWTASSIAMVESAAVAFRQDNKYIVVFGFGDAESLYKKYRPLVRVSE